MKDQSCISFLQWALPRLHMRWPGFKKVRKQVCKRLSRRLGELGLPSLTEYRNYLADNPREWALLDSLCRITISRFYRNRGVCNTLRSQILPELADRAGQIKRKELSCWCIGSASGEEPYTISLIWDQSGLGNQGVELAILATEIDHHMISRARNACYPESSIRELPSDMKDLAFYRQGPLFCLKERHCRRVVFAQQDIRNKVPSGRFDLVLCRNLVFTYFSRTLQEEILQEMLQCIDPGGFLVLGSHEQLPDKSPELTRLSPGMPIYRKGKNS